MRWLRSGLSSHFRSAPAAVGSAALRRGNSSTTGRGQPPRSDSADKSLKNERQSRSLTPENRRIGRQPRLRSALESMGRIGRLPYAIRCGGPKTPETAPGASSNTLQFRTFLCEPVRIGCHGWRGRWRNCRRGRESRTPSTWERSRRHSRGRGSRGWCKQEFFGPAAGARRRPQADARGGAEDGHGSGSPCLPARRPRGPPQAPPLAVAIPAQRQAFYETVLDGILDQVADSSLGRRSPRMPPIPDRARHIKILK